MNPTFEALGFASGLLGLSVAAPQLIRVLRAKTHTGVSPLAWIISLGNFSLWAAYGVRYDSISQLVTNIVAVLLTVALVYTLVNQSRGVWVATAVSAGTIVGGFFLGYATPVWLMTALLFGMILAARIPQIIASYRQYHQGVQTVVSKTTYVLMSASSIGWITYGALTGLWHNIVASSMTLTASFIILYFETRKRVRAVDATAVAPAH